MVCPCTPTTVFTVLGDTELIFRTTLFPLSATYRLFCLSIDNWILRNRAVRAGTLSTNSFSVSLPANTIPPEPLESYCITAAQGDTPYISVPTYTLKRVSTASEFAKYES